MPNREYKDVLQIIEGPFRKLNVYTHQDKAYRLPWETVLIGRRLVLIVIKTFVINTFHRLCLMQFFMNLFIVHHIYARPFSNNSLNKIETISLSMLSIICFLNLIPAYNYAYPVHNYDHSEATIQIFKIIETCLNLIFPFLIGIIVVIFSGIRIFQFIFWLCGWFVRSIRFCILHLRHIF